MKKKNLLLTVSILFSTLLGCDKLPINGKLDGMWQLMEIEYSGIEEIEYPEKVYYNIQLQLITLRQVHDSNTRTIYTGYFNHTADSLIIYDFRYYQDESQLVTLEQLAPFGIYDTYERFGIEKLTVGKMILKSSFARLTFRKF